ncbi:hypothetical protein PTH_2687 [Pelotomaculum thermopropionicum SI]|uniref:Uncharacterized protein n=1 Tax=Pelotomaculum thermopropionicum (strain DSM 13744 / JCM 10971 / SI) TaxID=370438 RepID=A5CYR6_PELTS|nr:hypothetical protein PTH_2687 [Pelotomaculum thermopropionicum SI]
MRPGTGRSANRQCDRYARGWPQRTSAAKDRCRNSECYQESAGRKSQARRPPGQAHCRRPPGIRSNLFRLLSPAPPPGKRVHKLYPAFSSPSRPFFFLLLFQLNYNRLGRSRKGICGDPQFLLPPAARETAQKVVCGADGKVDIACFVMHRQHILRLKLFNHPDRLASSNGVKTSHRDHKDVHPADLFHLLLLQHMAQVPQVANPQPLRLNHKDGILPSLAAFRRVVEGRDSRNGDAFQIMAALPLNYTGPAGNLLHCIVIEMLVADRNHVGRIGRTRVPHFRAERIGHQHPAVRKGN